MVKIGEQIKTLRIENKLTQERLAEILNVSPQAISRWENASTYPDINMLPSIAIFFDVTVDELLGLNEKRTEEAIAKIHGRVHQLVEEEEIDLVISELRTALKQYPNNYGLMSELAMALTMHQNYNVSSEHFEEAIKLSELILEKSKMDKLKSTVKSNLCFVYLYAGYRERAVALAKTLPHVWESREILLPEIEDEGLKTCLLKAINVIYGKIISNDTSTIKMLLTGPEDFEEVTLESRVKVIYEYLKNN